MDRLRTILVGVDFSPSSAAALSQALRLSRPNPDSTAGAGAGGSAEGASNGAAAEVFAAHIIETGVVIELQEAYAPFVRDLPESMVADAQQRWPAFAADVPGKERVRLEVVVGSPIVELCRIAQARNVDLIVAGTHGAGGGGGGPEGEGVGTLAAQLVRRVPTKVLLVREKQPGPFRKIVACVDFSETSRRALLAASQVAAHDGAELHVLHVFRAPWKQVHWHSPTPQATPDFQKQYTDALRQRLEEFAKGPAAEARRAEGAPCRPVIELFDSVDAGTGGTGGAIMGHGAAISEYARRSGADLIVLGTKGRSNLKAFFLGSTAERVLRHVPCSVLAVQPAAEG